MDLRDLGHREYFEKIRLRLFPKKPKNRAADHSILLAPNMLGRMELIVCNQLYCTHETPPLSAVISEVNINFYRSIGYPSSLYPNSTILCLRDESLITNIAQT